MACYEKKLHFFLNNGKDEIPVTCLQSFLNVYRHLPDNQYIMAFHGYLELGVVEYLEEYELVRVGGRGLSRFTTLKNKDAKYFVFDARDFENMCTAELSLEEFLKRVRPDIIFHIGTEDEKCDWSYYQMTKVSKYIRYSHPQATNEEMQAKRDAEKRVIFWDLEPKKRDELWFEGRVTGRLEINTWKDLVSVSTNEAVTAYLGNINIGAVWMDIYDGSEMTFTGYEAGGLSGAVFPDGEDSLVMAPHTLEAFLGRKISLEEFIYVSYYDGENILYDIKVVSDPQEAWQLIQEGWRLATRVKDIMEDMPDKPATEDERVIFVKAR